MNTIKKLLSTIALALVATLSLQNSVFAAEGYTKGKYTIDPAHSRVSFIVPHFVVSEVEGRFNEVKGDIVMGKSFKDTKMTATVPAASIDTGVKQRDDHLRSKDFFEVEKYPEIKFVSKSIAGTADAFQMVVSITMKDVTKDVIFEGKYTGSVKDTWGNQRIALQAEGSLNRKDFNINYDDKIDLGPAVGEVVKVRLWSEGILQTKDSKKK